MVQVVLSYKIPHSSKVSKPGGGGAMFSQLAKRSPCVVVSGYNCNLFLTKFKICFRGEKRTSRGNNSIIEKNNNRPLAYRSDRFCSFLPCLNLYFCSFSQFSKTNCTHSIYRTIEAHASFAQQIIELTTL